MVKPETHIEQYLTRVTPSEHLELLAAAQWLMDNNYPIRKTKFDITRYALNNLLSFVKFKQKKLEEPSKLTRIDIEEFTEPEKSPINVQSRV